MMGINYAACDGIRLKGGQDWGAKGPDRGAMDGIGRKMAVKRQERKIICKITVQILQDMI